MSAALEDDADPTYTHFSHRLEFLTLLDRFLAIDLRSSPDQTEDEEEERMVGQLGAIVSSHLSPGRGAARSVSGC